MDSALFVTTVCEKLDKNESFKELSDWHEWEMNWTTLLSFGSTNVCFWANPTCCVYIAYFLSSFFVLEVYSLPKII